MPNNDLQEEVAAWTKGIFTHHGSEELKIRLAQLLEEVIELALSLEVNRHTLKRFVAVVSSAKEKGVPHEELGDVALSLSALANEMGEDFIVEGWEKLVDLKSKDPEEVRKKSEGKWYRGMLIEEGE